MTHASLTTPFGQRAGTAVHPLSAYLLRLMDLKASNLCVSADVSTARELLLLADRVGPSIVVLKTHYDLVTGWDYSPQTGTGAQLAALARKHGFLLFEDRKFADIGKTVQQQYTAGTARLIEWAHLVTVNMDGGAPVVGALADAARHWRERVHYEVKTSVTVGTPVHESFAEEDEADMGDVTITGTAATTTAAAAAAAAATPSPTGSAAAAPRTTDNNAEPERTSIDLPRPTDGRKGSIVSITTVTQHFEPVDSPRLPRSLPGDSGGVDGGEAGAFGLDGYGAVNGTASFATGFWGDSTAHGVNSTAHGANGGSSSSSSSRKNKSEPFPGIEPAPLERGILLLAQMSSKGNLMTEAYTQACVEAARAHPDFVVGFVAQQNLNSLPEDTFIHMTPGCKLPPPRDEADEESLANGGGSETALAGDGLGQQYNTPERLVGICGTDIVIVGRGIILAGSPAAEAERYRRAAWKAYLSRLARLSQMAERENI